MTEEFLEPTEEDNIDCHLQQMGTSGLVCRAAVQGDGTTNEVSPFVCFNCPSGKIFREIGCDAVAPKIRLLKHMAGVSPMFENLFCKLKKRDTTLESCQDCNLVVADTTKKIVSTARGLFKDAEFYSAYQDIEKAREAIRDGNFENAITRSISSFESVMRTYHEKLGEPLPAKKQISDLWKSTRKLLDVDSVDSTGAIERLMNSLTGAVTHLGTIRNVLSDAHGKGEERPVVNEAIAELAINTSSTLATTILRIYRKNMEAS